MAWNTAGNIRGPQGVQGVPGAKGDTGPIGPAVFRPRGAYDAATRYVTGDVVRYGGSSFYALDPAPAVGVLPYSGDDDTMTNPGWSYLAVEGARGLQGVPGEQGPIGPAGATGGTGPQGLQGLQGAPGPKGDTGAAGVQGQKGEQGIQGVAGPAGTQGTQGVKGDTGAAGATGATGVRGTRWFVGTGGPTDANTAGAINGDQYLDGSTGDIYTLTV